MARCPTTSLSAALARSTPSLFLKSVKTVHSKHCCLPLLRLHIEWHHCWAEVQIADGLPGRLKADLLVSWASSLLQALLRTATR